MARGKGYLAPNTGAGLRNPTSNSTGPDRHGQAVNPPRMAKFGGFTSTRKAASLTSAPSIRRPGFEK